MLTCVTVLNSIKWSNHRFPYLDWVLKFQNSGVTHVITSIFIRYANNHFINYHLCAIGNFIPFPSISRWWFASCLYYLFLFSGGHLLILSKHSYLPDIQCQHFSALASVCPYTGPSGNSFHVHHHCFAEALIFLLQMVISMVLLFFRQ